MNRLYYGADSTSLSLDFSQDMLFDALVRIYEQKGGKPGSFDRGLFDSVFSTFDSAVTQATAKESAVSDGFADKLHHSAAVFSAFKVHKAQADMARLLRDSNGNLKPFEQWSNDVLPIASHQFGPWLRTEYNTAVLRAQQAADWQRFERYKDILPNLRWVPSTSVKPGADHMVFWGTTLPIDHPFWSSHRPGDRWNCKCSLAATDEPPTASPAENEVPLSSAPQRGLKDNPGKSGNLFDQSHPYYPTDCSACPFNSGFRNRLGSVFHNRKKDCANCSKINKAIALVDLSTIKDNKKFHEAAKSHPEISHTYYDSESGGVLAINRKHNIGLPSLKKGVDMTEEWIAGMTGKQNGEELTVAMKFVKKGRRVVLLPEKEKGSDGNEMSALDMELDGVRMDIKTVIGVGKYSNFLLDKNEQLRKYNSRSDQLKQSDTLCVYFPNGDYNQQKMLHDIKYFKQMLNGSATYIKHIVIINNNADEIFYLDI